MCIYMNKDYLFFFSVSVDAGISANEVLDCFSGGEIPIIALTAMYNIGIRIPKTINNDDNNGVVQQLNPIVGDEIIIA